MTTHDPGHHPWNELRLDLVALLWPSSCVACGAADRVCCLPCLAEVSGGPDPEPLRRELPRPGILAPLELRAAGHYDGALRSALVAYKHAGSTGLARPIGARLGRALRAALRASPPHPVLVAVPSRPARVRERGFRHLEPLIRAALRVHPAVPVRPELALRALRTTRGRRSQVGLDRWARRSNAARIAVRRSSARRLRGRAVILIDDVCTSGATLAAAADALEHVGARVVSVVSICVVEENAEPGGSGARGSDRVRERRNGAPGRRPPA